MESDLHAWYAVNQRNVHLKHLFHDLSYFDKTYYVISEVC